MKHTMLTRLGAAGLAAATITTGLAFGPAAANAAPVVSPTTAPLVFSSAGSYWAVSSTGSVTSYSKFGDAYKNAAKFNIPGTTTGLLRLNGTNSCIADGGSYFTSVTTCNTSETSQGWRLDENHQIVRSSGPSPIKINDGKLGVNKGTFATFATFSGAVQALDLHARTADLVGLAVPNSTVILNDTVSIPVGADGAWSYTVTGLKLGKNDIKLEQYEGDNNKTGETSVVADLAVVPITASSTFVAGDVSKPMTISGTAQAGANVEIWQGDTKLRTVPAAAVTGAFTADIAAPNAGGVQSYTLKQVIDGETAADTATVTADFGAQVAITTPANDMIHDGGALRFQGRGVAGGKVDLREQGKQGVIGTATVLANGIWTIDAANIPGKKATYVATQTGKGNNVTTSAVTLNPDGNVTAPVVSPIAEGSNIVSGSGATPGSTIIVKDEDGNELGRDTVDEHGNWSVTVPPTLGPGKHDLEIVERNDDGDESDPTKVTVDFGAAIVATNAVADDKGIVTYTGTGQAGATVEVKGKSGRVLATTTVKADGTWTAVSTMALPAQTYTVDAFQSTGIGVKSSSEISFEVKNTTPVAKAVQFTGPARNSTVFTNTPTFSGTGEPGANIKVGGTVRTVGETTVKADGTWTVKSNVALENDSYALRALQTPANGAAQSTDTNPFTITYKAAEKLQVLSPAADSTVAGPRPTFTGTGDAGATITIKGATRTVATAVVQNDGTWTATSTIDLAKDVYNLTVAQDALNGDMEQTTVKFTVK